MADGFLGRWSQRKVGARLGQPLDEPPPPVLPVAAPEPAQTPSAGAAPDSAVTAPQAKPQAPTLQDVQTLGRESDYSRFVARDVDPTVRNAAMKKLFTDPHFNTMDGLDTYIDDYSLPDPLPLSMLKTMVSAQFLQLFDTPPAEPATQEPASTPLTIEDTHAHTDLRLQQDHAAGPARAGDGTQ